MRERTLGCIRDGQVPHAGRCIGVIPDTQKPAVEAVLETGAWCVLARLRDGVVSVGRGDERDALDRNALYSPPDEVEGNDVALDGCHRLGVEEETIVTDIDLRGSMSWMSSSPVSLQRTWWTV